MDFITQKLFKRSSEILKLSRSVFYISNEISLKFQCKIPSLRPSTTYNKLQHVFDSKLTESPTVILDFRDLNSTIWKWFLHSFEAMVLRFLLHLESVTPQTRGSVEYPSTRGNTCECRVTRHFSRKSGRVSFVRASLPKYKTCIYLSQTMQYIQYIK